MSMDQSLIRSTCTPRPSGGALRHVREAHHSRCLSFCYVVLSLELVNKLQDAYNNVGIQNPIDLPQITVLGSQSS
ncbi:unnamed protein product [Tilletia controversa]|nr:unnamed protein product [Tilletia controversa]